MESAPEKPKNMTFIRTSAENITYFLDLTSKGLLIFCITCDIILLAVFIPLLSSIPLAGKGVALIVTLITGVVIPLSILLVFGTIASLRKKEITVDRASNLLTLTVKYGGIRRNRTIPFENVEAILLEPPTGLFVLKSSPFYELLPELAIMSANGKHTSIARMGRRLRGNDLEWLKDELIGAIFRGKEKPVGFLTARIKMVKSPGIDGETIIQLSKMRSGDSNMVILFMCLMCGLCAFAWILDYFTGIPVSEYGISFGPTGSLISIGIFGSMAMGYGVIYLSRRVKAVGGIIVDENAGTLTLKRKRGQVKRNLKVSDINTSSLVVMPVPHFGKYGVSSVTFDNCPTLKMRDGQLLRLFKSDRLVDARILTQILGILIRHAQRKQRNPNIPSLPLLTYETLQGKEYSLDNDAERGEKT